MDEDATIAIRYITGPTHGGQPDTRGVFNKPHAVALVEAHAISLDVPASMDEGATMALSGPLDAGATMALPGSVDEGATMAIPTLLDEGTTVVGARA